MLTPVSFPPLGSFGEDKINNEENLAPIANEPLQPSPSVSNFHSFLISTLTLSIILFISKTSLILNSTQLLALSLFFY